MTTPRLALAALIAALAALPAAPLAASPRHVPGEVLVKFKDGTASARRARALETRAHLPVAALDRAWARVRVRPDETVEEAIAGYVGDPEVEWAQPNYVYRAFAAPADDPLYAQQWALRNVGQTIAPDHLQAGGKLYRDTTTNPGTANADIDAEGAWNLLTDCSAAVVAVVDTGVNYLHQDLAANMWQDPASATTAHGWNFVDDDGDPMDSNGHGTHVAGIIAARANNGTGTVGVCWTARIMAVRAMDAVGMGTTAWIAAGIDYAVAHGAGVINLSLGAYASDAALEAAIADAIAAGVVVVVAAGNETNDNDRIPVYPCNAGSADVLCVAALDQRLDLAYFSNYGASSVDVGAPGTNVLSTYVGTQTRVEEPLTSGWSFSATSGTGFGYATARDADGLPVSVIADPSGNGLYPATTNDRAWKTFDTSGADVAIAEFVVDVTVSRGDWFRAACRAAGGDPFAAGGVLLEEQTGVDDYYQDGLDLTPCRGATSTLGFQLQSSPPSSTRDLGILIAYLTLQKLNRNATSYDTLAGTSMAAPVVAGVAALVRAYQPAFTPADVYGAITGGGRTVPSLARKVKSGKAVQAHEALRYVNPPRGLSFLVVK